MPDHAKCAVFFSDEHTERGFATTLLESGVDIRTVQAVRTVSAPAGPS